MGMSVNPAPPNQGGEETFGLQEGDEQTELLSESQTLTPSTKADIDAVMRQAIAYLTYPKQHLSSSKGPLESKSFKEAAPKESKERCFKKFEQQVSLKEKLTSRQQSDLVKVKKGQTLPFGTPESKHTRSAKRTEAKQSQTERPFQSKNQSPSEKSRSPSAQMPLPHSKLQQTPSKSVLVPGQKKTPLPQKNGKGATQSQEKNVPKPPQSKKLHARQKQSLREGCKQDPLAQNSAENKRSQEKDERGRGDRDQQESSQEQKKREKKRKIAVVKKKEGADAVGCSALEKADHMIEKTFSKKTAHVPPPPPLRIHSVKPISLGSVMDLFFELLKLFITHREQNRHSRREERNLQILHKKQEISNLRQQGQWLLTTGIGAGVLGIASGALPILGVVKGEWIQQNLLGRLSSKLADMKTDKLFRAGSKMAHSLSETYKTTGQITTTYAESDRKWEEEKNTIARTESDEFSSELREKQDDWHAFLRFIQEVMQMDQDAIRMLYR